MNKKVKLIIEIVIFLAILGIVGGIYYFNTKDREEVEEEAVSVGVVKITDDNFEEEVIKNLKEIK